MTEIEEEFFSISSRSLRSSVKKFSSLLDVRDWLGEILILVSKLKKWLSLTSGISLPIFGAGSAISWIWWKKTILSSLVCLLKFYFSWLWEKFHMSISQPICLLSIWVVFHLTHSPHRFRIKKWILTEKWKQSFFHCRGLFLKTRFYFEISSFYNTFEYISSLT